MSQTDLWRLETSRRRLTVIDLVRIAVALGLEVSAGLHPAGDPVRDKGHQALIRRFRMILAASWSVVAEVPLTSPDDRRAWDLVLRAAAHVVGVECETRLRDIQAFTRRIRQREESATVNVTVVVLADTATNRRLVHQLREALGPTYATPPARILAALRKGQPVPGSGVVLL